jgi:hypothetical protein
MVLYYVLLRGWTGLGSGELAVRSLSVVAGVAAIPAIYLLGKRLFGPKAGRVAALLLSVHVLIWLALPVTLVLAISLRWPAFEPRFLIFCVPLFALLAADALAQVRSKLLFATTLMIVLGLSLNGTYSYYRARADTEHSDNWRDATRFVLSQAQMGDAVLFIYSEERIAFDAYQRQFQMTGSVIHEFPEQTDLELLTLRPSRPSAELLENLVAKYRRVWVLSAFQPNRASRQAEAVLRNHFSEYRDRSFGFVHAYLFADHIPYADHQQEEPR